MKFIGTEFKRRFSQEGGEGMMTKAMWVIRSALTPSAWVSRAASPRGSPGKGTLSERSQDVRWLFGRKAEEKEVCSPLNEGSRGPPSNLGRRVGYGNGNHRTKWGQEIERKQRKRASVSDGSLRWVWELNFQMYLRIVPVVLWQIDAHSGRVSWALLKCLSEKPWR